jgi:hypothetical protein
MQAIEIGTQELVLSNKALQAPPRHCFACRGTLAPQASLGAPERER